MPAVKTALNIENQPIAVTVSGVISGVSAVSAAAAFKLKLAADLSDLQQNMTVLLRSELNRSERCGDRLSVSRATLAPAAPSGLLTATLHYEKWGCAKVFGKQVVKRLAGGNGTIQVRLTPIVDANSTVRLAAEMGSVEADGSLGELLRSGSLGAALRDKVRTTLSSAMEKANLAATVPREIQTVTTIQSAEFADGGEGRLLLGLTGEVRVSGQQLQLLIEERRAQSARAA